MVMLKKYYTPNQEFTRSKLLFFLVNLKDEIQECFDYLELNNHNEISFETFLDHLNSKEYNFLDLKIKEDIF